MPGKLSPLRPLGLAITATTVALLAALGPASVVQAKSYYLDADGGNDGNAGTSPEVAWATLGKASDHKLKPGDKLLLERGDVFRGKLQLTNCSGTTEKPIAVGAYGKGDRPKIDAASHHAGVHLVNSNFVKVSDLEITADGGAPTDGSDEKERFGVLVNAWGNGTANGIELRNLHLHAIYPHAATESEGTNPTTYMGVAIKVIGSSDAPASDLLVEGCQIENTGHAVLHAIRTSHLTVLDNVMTNIGGPAMVPNRCDDLVVRGNTVDHSGAYTDERMHGRGSGIWPIHCKRVLIEKNRFMHARGRYDSCGAHIDIGNRNVVIQYNLSIDNEGGFVEILGENFNCAYRYNISINDGARVHDKERKAGEGHVILFSGHNGKPERAGPTHCYIYNNTIYVKRGQHCSFSIEDTTSNVLVANNLFYVEGEAKNGTPKWWGKYPEGIEDGIYWTNNLYQRKGIFPSDWPFTEQQPMVKNPRLANAGGLTAEDYIPAAKSPVINRGMEITKIPGDEVGLKMGLAVESDYFGNPIVGRPDVGAVEVSDNSAAENSQAAPDADNDRPGERDATQRLVDAQGRSIAARILHVDTDYAYVQVEERGSFALPLTSLSDATQKSVAAWKQAHARSLTAEQELYLRSLREARAD